MSLVVLLLGCLALLWIITEPVIASRIWAWRYDRRWRRYMADLRGVAAVGYEPMFQRFTRREVERQIWSSEWQRASEELCGELEARYFEFSFPATARETELFRTVSDDEDTY